MISLFNNSKLAASIALIFSLSPLASANEVTVTTWNIEHLGSAGRGFGGGFSGFGRGSVPPRKSELPRRGDEECIEIAKLIREELGSEVLALQEVGVTGRRRGRSICEPLDKVVDELEKDGESWAYFLPQIDETPEDDDPHNTHLAFMWNQDQARLLSVFEMPIANQSLGGKALFDRPPLIGYFETIREDGKPGNDFVLVNVHLASGQNRDENHLIAMTVIEYELANSLAKHAIAESDVVILGDFNDNPGSTRGDGSPLYSPALHQHLAYKGYRNLTSTDFATTRMNAGLDSLIDHVLVNRYAQAYVEQAEASIYKPGKGKGGDSELFAAWRRTFSDHFPLSFEMNVKTDTDVDFFD